MISEEFTKQIEKECFDRLVKLGLISGDDKISFNSLILPLIICRPCQGGEFWFLYKNQRLVGFKPSTNKILRILN